jgi:hypothetical protein
METLIRNAWRAFWVGLGASVVLIGQSVVTGEVAARPGVLAPAPAAGQEEVPALRPPTPMLSKIRLARRLRGQS